MVDDKVGIKEYLGIKINYSNENNLYKFVGNDNQKSDVGIYQITYKLGLRDANNHYIYEYSKSNRDSFIEDNNVSTILRKESEAIKEFPVSLDEEIETLDGEIYDSTEEDNLETELDCP